MMWTVLIYTVHRHNEFEYKICIHVYAGGFLIYFCINNNDVNEYYVDNIAYAEWHNARHNNEG